MGRLTQDTSTLENPGDLQSWGNRTTPATQRVLPDSPVQVGPAPLQRLRRLAGRRLFKEALHTPYSPGCGIRFIAQVSREASPSAQARFAAEATSTAFGSVMSRRLFQGRRAAGPT